MIRKYDPRKIKSNRSYTVDDLAALYDLHVHTVRVWIKEHGLSIALIDDRRPQALYGVKVKAWMAKWQASRKSKCSPGEMYCLSCKSPTEITPGSFRIVPSNTQKITAQGECGVCGRTLNRFDVRANIPALEREFKTGHLHL